MNIGPCTHVAPRQDFAHENAVVGIVVHQSFPEIQLVEETVRRGVAHHGPDAVWVVRESERSTRDLLERVGATNIVSLPLNPYWKWQDAAGPKIAWQKHRGKWFWGLQYREVDHRSFKRDLEFVFDCDEVVVFLPTSAESKWDNYADKEHVHVVRRGQKKRAKRN